MTLLVVRHAHAGERGRWNGDDRLRPLSRKGQAQAVALAAALAAHEPARIVSSPAVRCRETVIPLAASIGVDIDTDDRLLEGASGEAVRSLVDHVGVQTTIWCTHGDVIPMVLHELERRGMAPERRLRWPKASTWVVAGHGSDWGTGTYLAPPEISTAAEETAG